MMTIGRVILTIAGGRGEAQESDAARPPIRQVVDFFRVGEIDQQRVVDAGSGDRYDDRDDAQIVGQERIDAAERHPEKRGEGQRGRGWIAELSNEIGREILRRRGGRGERDVDSARDEDHESAGGEDRRDGVSFDQVHEIGERQKIGRRRERRRRGREDGGQERGLCASKDGSGQLTHRAASDRAR